MIFKRPFLALLLLLVAATGCTPYHGYKPETNPPPSTGKPPETTRPQTSAPPGYPGSK